MNKKHWWESKTIWLNILTLALGVLAVVADVVDTKTAAVITGTIVPVLNVFLRFITDKKLKALGSK